MSDYGRDDWGPEPLPLAQRHIGQDLGGAADDRGVTIDRTITGHQANVVGTEGVAERKELRSSFHMGRRTVLNHDEKRSRVSRAASCPFPGIRGGARFKKIIYIKLRCHPQLDVLDTQNLEKNGPLFQHFGFVLSQIMIDF